MGNLGLSMSEARCLLIKEELEGNLYTRNTGEIAATAEKSIQKDIRPYTRGTTNKPVSFSTRWTSNNYEFKNELPCPLCDQWYSRANFARHAKNHNTTIKEFLKNNEELVCQMIEKPKKDIQRDFK